jgi:5-formyltetrahydrofolate cyclo-ligase
LTIGGKEEGEKTRKRRFRILLSSGFQGSASNLSTLRGKGFDIFEEKSDLRRDLLDRRLHLSSRELNKISEKVKENLLRLECFEDARRVALYFPIRNEVRTEGIFERAKELGKETYFPRVEGSMLQFRKVSDLGELGPGRFGVPEPSRDSTKVEIEEIDLVVVPGVAFDRFGRRLGYGKGYYDRTLLKIDRKRRIGLAHSFQVLSSIPVGKSDEEVGLIVTESGVIFCERRMKQ